MDHRRMAFNQSISKYLQLNIIECDESLKSQSTNKKASLPKDMGYGWL